MFLEFKSPRGGRQLGSSGRFPVDADPKTNQMGFKVGYAGEEPIIVRFSDAERIANIFGVGVNNYFKTIRKMNNQISIKHKLIKLLGGFSEPPG